jgi:hypothetical protein
VRIVAGVLAKDREVIPALGQAQSLTLDAGKRLEGGTGGAPAVRAVAVGGVDEFVGHRVLHGTAQAGFLHSADRRSLGSFQV